MDWTTKAAWLYEDDTVDFAKLAKYGIGVVYIDPRSTDAAQVIASLETHGILAGIYAVPSWPGVPATAAGFAKWISDLANVLLPKGSKPEAPPVMLDLETADIVWVANAVSAYRTHQPRRPTSYTNAPWQDASVVPVGALQQAGLHWYVQLYYGDMNPADAAAAVLEVARFYPPSMVHPFYDGAHVTSDERDGCAFTLERMR